MLLSKKYSFLYFTLTFFVLVISNGSAGTVILLNGTSSAGKSSIAQELKKALLPNNVEILSIDIVFYEVAREIIKERGYAVDPNKSWTELCESLPEELVLSEKEIIPRAEKKLYEKIKHHAASDKYVILDAVICNTKHAEKWAVALDGLVVQKVLVYCTPTKLLEHVIQRNTDINEEEHRPLTQPFFQFFKMFTIQKSGTDQYIEEINPQALETLITKNFADPMPTMNEGDLKRAKKVIENYQPKFACKTGEQTIKIVPEPFVTYDIVVNAGTSSAKECAQQIIKKLND